MDPRTILEITGNVITFSMFLSPIPTIVRFHEKKSTEEFHPHYYLAGMMSCMLWVIYGAIQADSTLWTINGIGLIMYEIYMCTFYCFTKRKWRRVIFDVSFFGVIAIYALLFSVAFSDQKFESTTVETICIVFNIIFYASPLTVLIKVFKTKSVEYLPFWVSLAGFANASFWTIYGLLSPDGNLLVGNGLGAVLSAIPLILHLIIEPFKMIFGNKFCPKRLKQD